MSDEDTQPNDPQGPGYHPDDPNDTPAPLPPESKKAKKAAKPAEALTVKALQNFGSEETGDLRTGDIATLPSSKTLKTLIKSGYLAEVNL